MLDFEASKNGRKSELGVGPLLKLLLMMAGAGFELDRWLLWLGRDNRSTAYYFLVRAKLRLN